MKTEDEIFEEWAAYNGYPAHHFLRNTTSFRFYLLSVRGRELVKSFVDAFKPKKLSIPISEEPSFFRSVDNRFYKWRNPLRVVFWIGVIAVLIYNVLTKIIYV